MDNQVIGRIKSAMVKSNMSINSLSQRSQINILNLFIILYCPFSRIKLTQYIGICKALNKSMSELL